MSAAGIKVITPTGRPILGTFERVQARAECVFLGLNADGTYEVEHTGDTEVFWDTQETATTERGERLFLDDQGAEWPETALVGGTQGKRAGEKPTSRPYHPPPPSRDKVALFLTEEQAQLVVDGLEALDGDGGAASSQGLAAKVRGVLACGTKANGAELAAARRLHCRSDDVEVDDGALASHPSSGAGAWVQAWVWVPENELEAGAHTRDEQCSAFIGSDGTCTACGVLRGPPCHACGGRSFHRGGCPELQA